MINKLIVFLLLCCPVLAGDAGMCVRGKQTIKERTVHMTVTRIPDFENGHSAWITAGHCVEVGAPVTLTDAIGESHQCEVVADSQQPDVALIKGPVLLKKVHFRLVDKSPRSAVVSSYVVNRSKFYQLTLEDTGELLGNRKAEQGESGAPVYTNDEVYGLLIGNTADTRQCYRDRYGRQFCQYKPGRVTFERSRTIIKWLETTGYQACEPFAK